MNYIKKTFACLALLLFAVFYQSVKAADHSPTEDEKPDISGMIIDHLADAYEWHVISWGDKHISIPLPVILISEKSGLNVFLSSHFHHGHDEYKGFYIAHEGSYEGKIVERGANGEELRPWDLSITKNVFSIMISSVLLIFIILSVARWYKKNNSEGDYKAPKGFVGMMEMFIMMINDDLIRPCIGKNYRKFAPYLLTVFFFILLNNLLGLVPIFPGGANVTGNIGVTFVLAMFTFVFVNFFGTKEYYKEIYNPEVPGWLKSPVFPLMQIIEVVGVFTKPFALMVRLFANILAGHSIVLGLMSLIFVTASLGTAINSGMTTVSLLMTVFMDFVELLVAFIQAYVFTMLSAVFIGLAQVEHHAGAHDEKNIQI